MTFASEELRNAERLYILDRTPLKRIDGLSAPPKSGDVIVYLRAAQDVNGDQAETLTSNGVKCVWGESLLDEEGSRRADLFSAKFVSNWHLEERKDFLQGKSPRFGCLFDPEITLLTHPFYIVRTGEVIRRAINLCPNAKEILADIENGFGIDLVKPAYRPLGLLCEQISKKFGRKYYKLAVNQELPYTIMRKKSWITWGEIVSRYLGRFRPKWLMASLNLNRSLRFRNIDVYVMVGRGTESIIKKLSAATGVRLIVNRAGIPGTLGFRHDHLFVLPKYQDIRQAKKIIRRANSLARNTKSARYCFEGIDYGPLLAGAISSVIKCSIWKSIFVLAQFRKLQERLKFSVLITNGEAGFSTKAIIDLNFNTDMKVYFVGHGINVHKHTTFGMGHNSSHVTYFVAGEDHKGQFGDHLSIKDAPRKPVLGNPLTVLMASVKGLRSKVHGKRILVLGLGYVDRKADRFLIDIFKVGRHLSSEEWKITYRPHPHYGVDLEYYIARELGVAQDINWNNTKELKDVLLEHDVVVTGSSSVYYQCLYAGWPTIYYEPVVFSDGPVEVVFHEDFYVGLPGAKDIDWPVAHNEEELLSLLLDSLNPNSLTSRFPEKFSGELSPRFIGPDPKRADSLIANFILEDLGVSNSSK